MRKQFLGLVLVGGLLLGACGAQSENQSPTPLIDAQPNGGATPTIVDAQPNDAATPTIVDAQAGEPAFAFEPQQGAPGTQVTLHGWNFNPNDHVIIRLGLPQPTGEALASVVSDERGEWTTTLIIPANLPSGAPIPTGGIRLVAMNSEVEALASAPFTVAEQVGGEITHEGAVQTVNDFLSSVVNKGDMTVYLASNVLNQISAGQTLNQVLNIPLELTSFEVHGVDTSRPSEVLFVNATLHTGSTSVAKIFTLVVENGAWKIHGSAD